MVCEGGGGGKCYSSREGGDLKIIFYILIILRILIGFDFFII